MQGLMDLIPLLKVGASNDTHPLYAQYLHSSGNVLRTCNNEVYVCIEQDVPFVGCVNIYTLSDTLSKIKGNIDSINHNEANDILEIDADSFHSELAIHDIDFPTFKDPNIDSIFLDEDMIRIIKASSKFVGNDILSYIYIDNKGLIATNRSRIFTYDLGFSREDLVMNKPIAINNKILSILKEGFSIGTDTLGNTVVEFDGGFASFTVDSLEFYPSDKIRAFVNQQSDGFERLCNVALVQDCVEKVAPVLHGENQTFVALTNTRNLLTVKAESPVNGESTIDVNSDYEGVYSIIIDLKYFKDIPIDFNVYVSEKSQHSLMLKNANGGTLVLLGAV